MKFFNFFRKETAAGHALGSDEGIQEAIDALPSSNPGRRLEEIGDWIGESEKTGLDLAMRARAYARLDEAGREADADLSFHMVCAPIDRAAFERGWGPLARYLRQTLYGYSELLRDDEAGGENRLSSEVTGRLILRALRAAMRLKKLLHMRIQPVPDDLYVTIYWLFLLAERKQLSLAPVKIYPDVAEPATIQQEFAAGMAFEIGPWQNFTPEQMEAFDLLVRKFAGNFAFRSVADRQTGYAVDLASRNGPFRLRGEKPQSASLRYLGTGIVLGFAAKLLKHLRGGGAVPNWLALPGRHPAGDYITLLKKLQMCWSIEASERRQPRETCALQIDALHGFREIRRMLASIEYVQSGRSTTYRHERPGEEPKAKAPDAERMLERMESAGDRLLMQQWAVIDRSRTGIGACAQRPCEWLRVGVLVGFRASGSMQWSVAVARRLSRDGRGRILIGMELFGSELAVARAGALDRLLSTGYEDPFMASDGPVFGWYDAIVIGGAPTLLMPSGRYGDGARYLLNIGARRKYVRLTQLLEEGEDYCLSHYEEYVPD